MTDWKLRYAIAERAKYRCEDCGLFTGKLAVMVPNLPGGHVTGRLKPGTDQVEKCETRSKFYVYNLDRDPKNKDPDNYLFLCASCWKKRLGGRRGQRKGVVEK